MLSVQSWTASNITLRDSPSFHILARGDRLSVTHVRVEANLDDCGGYESAPNTDGLNVGGTNIFVSNTFVHNGDDCIPLGDADVLPPYVTARNTQNVIAENVHCECGTNSAVTIVGAGPSTISDVIFRNFTVLNLNQGAGMKISEAYRNCTGEVRNATWDGFDIRSPRNTAVYINVYEEDAEPSQCAMPSNPDRPGWMTATDLTFKNIVATDMNNAYAGCFACSPSRPCTGIRFDNVTIGTAHPYKCFNIQAMSSESSPAPCN